MSEFNNLVADVDGALPDASTLATAPVVVVGLVGGWLSARATGVRPVGGLVLAAAGALAARSWYARGGAGEAFGLAAVYLGAFGISHPLAKRVGPWPAVLTAAGAVAAAAHWVSDIKKV